MSWHIHVIQRYGVEAKNFLNVSLSVDNSGKTGQVKWSVQYPTESETPKEWLNIGIRDCMRSI
jgi:hypothetical protein